jgi:hypothetical protein
MAKFFLKLALRYYIFVSVVCALFFNWQYFQDQGQARWIKYGLIPSTVRALVWPLYYKSTIGKLIWTQEELANAQHFVSSTKLDVQATQIINQGLGGSGDSLKDFKNLRKSAFMEALQVRDDVLEKALEGMSIPYRQLFQKGLELELKGINTHDTHAQAEGEALHDQWVQWISTHGSKMKIPTFTLL